MILLDKKHTVFFANERASKMFTSQRLMGLSLLELSDEMSWPNNITNSILEDIKLNKNPRLLKKIQSSVSSEVTMQWSFYCIESGYIITGKDVSKDILIENENFMLSQIIEKAPSMIYWKDLDSKHLGCNEIFAKTAGLNNPEEMVGLTDFELIWSASAESYRQDDLDVMSTGEMKLNIEDKMMTKKGELTLITNKQPLRDRNNQIIGTLGTCLLYTSPSPRD